MDPLDGLVKQLAYEESKKARIELYTTKIKPQMEAAAAAKAKWELNLIELTKHRTINGNGTVEPPKTSAWSMGDYKTLREPPKKKVKGGGGTGKESKRALETGVAAVAPAAPGPQQQKRRKGGGAPPSSTLPT